MNNNLLEFYGDDIPAYVRGGGKTYLNIKTSDYLDQPKTLKITLKSVIEYYKTQARNITSGMRTLAGHSGDWRNIDQLAKEALEYFKTVNIDTLKREAQKNGMSLLN